MRVSGVSFVQGRNRSTDRDGAKYGIAIHATDNTAPATNEASYATRRPDGVGSHFYADATQVIQSIDTADRTGHAGSSAGNENAIAVEITGLSTWTRQQWLDRVAWNRLGAVLAQVCRTYGITVRRATVAEMQANPKVRAFYGHDDMRRAWGGTDHTDPGPGFPWDRLFAAVGGTSAATGDDDMQLSDKNPFGTKPAQFTSEDKDAGLWLLDGPNGTVGAALQYILENGHYARLFARRAAAEATALRTVVESLAAALKAGGGSVDTAAILAGVDERLAKLALEQRDAVADLGEGGAAQVRADA